MSMLLLFYSTCFAFSSPPAALSLLCLSFYLQQDLAVVPLLVAIPLLAGGGGGLAAALSSAATKAAIALGLIAFIGTSLHPE